MFNHKLSYYNKFCVPSSKMSIIKKIVNVAVEGKSEDRERGQ